MHRLCDKEGRDLYVREQRFGAAHAASSSCRKADHPNAVILRLFPDRSTNPNPTSLVMCRWHVAGDENPSWPQTSRTVGG